MTVSEFNEKYNQWLAPSFYGLAIHHPEVIEYLDKQFQHFIKSPNFRYFQIKMKFGFCCFFADGLNIADVREVEDQINKIYRDEQTS